MNKWTIIWDTSFKPYTVMQCLMGLSLIYDQCFCLRNKRFSDWPPTPHHQIPWSSPPQYIHHLLFNHLLFNNNHPTMQCKWLEGWTQLNFLSTLCFKCILNSLRDYLWYSWINQLRLGPVNNTWNALNHIPLLPLFHHHHPPHITTATFTSVKEIIY